MASKTSQQAILGIQTGAIVLSSGITDLHLVTVAPVGNAATGADLTVATGGNYVPAAASLTTPTIDGDGASYRITVSSVTWSVLTTSGTNIVGVAFTKRVGGSYATSDPFFSYIEFGTAYTPPTSSGVDFVFIVPATGVLKGSPAV